MMRRIKIREEWWRIIGIYVDKGVGVKLEGLRNWMEDKEEGIKTIVGGDFNARTGERGGKVRGGDEDREEPERKLKDKIINAEGKVLLERLEELGWEIWNGSVKGDEEGELTYTGGNGESVVDYVLGDGETWDRVERIEVKDRIESDHFPLEVWLRGEEEELGRKVSRRRGRWNCTEKGRAIFEERMEK